MQIVCEANMSFFEEHEAKYIPEPNSGCWLWHGSCYKRGRPYGIVRRWRRGQKYAHRLAYEAAYGPIPAGKVVRHSCDTPACVNPNHLVLGTQAENVADMDARGRRYAGRYWLKARYKRGHHPKHRKITAEMITAIIDAHAVLPRGAHRVKWGAFGKFAEEMSARFGITAETVRAIVQGYRPVDLVPL